MNLTANAASLNVKTFFGCSQRFQWADLQCIFVACISSKHVLCTHVLYFTPYVLGFALQSSSKLFDLYQCPQGKSNRCFGGDMVNEGCTRKQIAIQLTIENWVQKYNAGRQLVCLNRADEERNGQ